MTYLENNSIVPRWRKYPIVYSQFSTAGLTMDVELFVLPAYGVIQGVWINPVTAFTGGLIVGYTISLGTSGSLAKYAIAQSVFTTTLLSAQQIMGIESSSAPTSIRAAAISTTGLLNTATQGSANIYVNWSTVE